MVYKQIGAATVFTAITNGYNVIICDFANNCIKYTNELTVADIRNYISKSDVAFFRIEEATS